jgi:hypothetical protein
VRLCVSVYNYGMAMAMKPQRGVQLLNTHALEMVVANLSN